MTMTLNTRNVSQKSSNLTHVPLKIRFVVIGLYQIYWGHCDALLNAVPMEKIWLQLPKPNNEYNLQNTLSNRMRLYFNSIFNKADSTIKKKNNEIR